MVYFFLHRLALGALIIATSTIVCGAPALQLSIPPTDSQLSVCISEYKEAEVSVGQMRSTIASMKSGSSVVSEADVVEAKASLIELEQKQAILKARIIEEIKDPAVEAELSSMLREILNTRNLRDRQALQIRYKLLRIKQAEQQATQVAALLR